MNGKFLTAFLLAAASAINTQASAALLTYTETADVSGSLNGVDFSDNTITLTAVGDTSGISHGGSSSFFLPAVLTFTLSGGGAGTFTDSDINVFVNQAIPGAGFEDFTIFQPILLTASSAFATYDLSTVIGPVTGGPINNGGTAFATTAGTLIIDSVNDDSTFTATIPEPATWAMMAIGFATLGLAGYRRRRRLA
jgi:hypothetical protein